MERIFKAMEGIFKAMERSPQSNLWTARWRSLVGLPLFLMACVDPGVEEDPGAVGTSDAFTTVSGIVDAAPPPPGSATESARLFFVAQGQGYAVGVSDPRPEIVCPLGRPETSTDGERVLCVPEEIGAPLVLKDLFSEQEIASYSPWMRESETQQPQISPRGSRVAYLDEEGAGYPEVVIGNDLAMEHARRDAFDILGFLGERFLVLDYPPRLWNLDQLELRPVVIDSYTFQLSADPPALVYEEGFEPVRVNLINEEGGAAQEIGRGELQDIYRGWVFTIERAFSGEETARMFPFQGQGEPRALALEGIGFDTQSTLRAVSDQRALLELKRVRLCDDENVQYTVETRLLDFAEETSRVIAEGESPHRVYLAGASEVAAVLATDRCGRLTGRGSIRPLSGELRPLPEPLNGELRAAAVSAGGGYLALAGADQVWLYDLREGEFQEVYNGGGVSPWLLFR